MNNAKDQRISVVNIGDGYGLLSVLIKQVFPKSTICLVDLGKSLLFQAYYCGRAYPNSSHYLVSALNANEARNADFVYCPNENINEINGVFSFDLAINIASMQEMNENSIKAYFDFLRRNLKQENLFYCCNREEKEMPGGEVSRFFSYPWKTEDIHFIDGYCPWQRYFFSLLYRAKNGLRILIFRIPFVNYFDGIIRHRLSKLYTDIRDWHNTGDKREETVNWQNISQNSFL